MDEQERDFNPAALLLLLPFAAALWKKYAPKRYATKPTERFYVRVLNGVKAEMKRDAQLLVDGKLSPAEWRLNFERYTDTVYVMSTAMLAGTFDISEQALTLGSEQWRSQADFAAGMIGDVQTGQQPQNGTLLNRVGLYAAAGWATWQALRGIQADIGGAVTEQRILGAADHCQDCIDAAALGKQPIGTLPVIGDSVCRSNCHCRFVYYDAQGNEVQL